MSTRRFRTWKFIQVILILSLTIVVALDLAARLSANQINEMAYEQLREAQNEAQKQPAVSSGISNISRYSKFTTLRVSGITLKSNKAGTKLRMIENQDLPPETRSHWVPSDDEVPVSRFPKALLVGFAKCGTSALLAFLNIHPNIVSLDWEIDYFCERVYYKYSLHWYRMRMPLSTSDQVTLEKSPCYGTEPAALERIQAFNSSIKIMVIVRDPYTRLLSQHGQIVASANNFGKDVETIEQRYIKDSGKVFQNVLLKWGTYNERVELLYSLFPKKQVHIIDGDLFIKNPLPVLKQIEAFLGVPSFFSEHDVYLDPEKGFHCPRNRETKETMCLSHNKGRQHVVPSEEFRRKVLAYLRPHSLRFFELIGQKFNWTL